MYTLVSSVHMTFCILTKRYTVSGNQDTYDKLYPVPLMSSVDMEVRDFIITNLKNENVVAQDATWNPPLTSFYL